MSRPEVAMGFISRFVIAALVGFLVSSLIALVSYSLGSSLARNTYNLQGMIYLSVPFALLLGVVAAGLPKLAAGKGSISVAVVAGAVLSLVYVYFVIRFSLVTLAFVILLLSSWVPAGVSAMLLAIRGRRIPDLIGISVLCLIAMFLTEPTFNIPTHNRQLTVRSLRLLMWPLPNLWQTPTLSVSIQLQKFRMRKMKFLNTFARSATKMIFVY